MLLINLFQQQENYCKKLALKCYQHQLVFIRFLIYVIFHVFGRLKILIIIRLNKKKVEFFILGILNMISEVARNEVDVIMLLWKHECYRVIADHFVG